MAIAPVLKTGVRKDIRVRIPGPPSFSAESRVPLSGVLTAMRSDWQVGFQRVRSAAAIAGSTSAAMMRYPASFGCTPSPPRFARRPCRSSAMAV